GSSLMLSSASNGTAEVMRLHDPERLQVRVDVPLADASHVGVDQEAEIVVNVLPDRTFKGRVTRMVHEADVQKNTIQGKVAIHDPAPEIKPEMLARVKFLAAPAAQPAGHARVFAPKELVNTDSTGAWVWLVDQTRNIAEQRRVTVGGAEANGWIEISDGLRP